jgi:hypothetical protein
MSILRVLTQRGDERVSWDPRDVAAGDPEALAAVREAERIFARARGRGAAAFAVRKGQPARRIEALDPEAQQIVMVPRVVGG